jgi:hypothetical protein
MESVRIYKELREHREDIVCEKLNARRRDVGWAVFVILN